MSENTETVTETEQTPVPVVEKPKVKQPKTKPEIRDPDDAILELRKENERLRKSLDDVAEERAEKMSEERIAKATEEAKTAAQKLLDEKMQEMEKATRNRVMKAELKAQAQRAGVVDFDDLYDVMKRAALSKVEFDADGDVLNAGEIIADMKQSKPHLFAGVNTSSTAPVPTAVRESKAEKPALSMSDSEYRTAKRKLFSI